MTTTHQPGESVDLDRLEALANSATKGPWMRLFGERTVYDRMEDGCRGNAIVRADVAFSKADAANLDFIAAANPATVLQLIALARRATQQAGVPQTFSQFGNSEHTAAGTGDADERALTDQQCDEAIAAALVAHARTKNLDPHDMSTNTTGHRSWGRALIRAGAALAKQAAAASEGQCREARCSQQDAHCNGACHGVWPDGSPVSTEGIAPCPFCGGKAHATTGFTTQENWPHGKFHRVFCGTCQSRQLFHRSKAKAVAAWNNRAPAPTAAVAGQDADLPNFCARCGKRLGAGSVHTCTPPVDVAGQDARDDFARGYYCAVAVLLREWGDANADVRSLFGQGADPSKADRDDQDLFHAHGLMPAIDAALAATGTAGKEGGSHD